MGRKLYRSRRQRLIAGVCGGLAEYFDIDVTIIRLAWLASIFLGGAGILVYILAALIIPDGFAYDADVDYDVQYTDASSQESRNKVIMGFGLILIVIGAYSLIERALPNYLLRQIKEFFWPGLLVLLGLVIIFSTLKKK